MRLSSAGLVYLHFPEVIDNVAKKILENDKDKLTFEPKINEEILKLIRDKIYKNFMIFVDANDNGVDRVDGK